MGKNLKKIVEVLGKAVVVLFFFGLIFFPVMFFGLLGASDISPSASASVPWRYPKGFGFGRRF